MITHQVPTTRCSRRVTRTDDSMSAFQMNAKKVSMAYTEDSIWRNRDQFFQVYTSSLPRLEKGLN